MRFALVNTENYRENTIEWDGVSPYEPPPGYSLVPEAEAPPMAAPAVDVPAKVSARQARLALHFAGLLPDIEADIAAEGGALAIEWEYATEIERASPFVVFVAAKRGMTDAQIDELFIDAAGR